MIFSLPQGPYWKDNMFVTIEKVLNLGHGRVGEGEERRGEEKRREESWGEEREGGIKRRRGRDHFFKPSYFYTITCLSLGKAFLQWVCTQRLKTLWQELRGRNLWLQDWAGRLDRSPPRNANSAHHILFFFGDLAKSDYTVEKPILFPISLQNFAQIQMFRNETVASKRLWNNLKLLTPTIPRTSLLGANNQNWGRAKLSGHHRSTTISLQIYTVPRALIWETLTFFFLIYNKYTLGRPKI